MFWVCAELRADNTEMFLLLLSRACTEPRLFLLLVLPHWGGDWGCLGDWEETEPGQVTPTDKGMFQTLWHHAQCIKAGMKEEGGNTWRDGVLSSQVTIMCDGALLSWRWLYTCLLMGSSE